MTANLRLMQDAKASLGGGDWGRAALAALVYTLILWVAGCLGVVGALIVGGPMILGFINYLKAIKRGDSPKLEVLFSGFNDFGRSFLAFLLIVIFIFLWSLLLIIPGIIMAYAYSMTMFIIADDPEISAMDAIRRSRDMMRGYKFKLFCLQLRFFGWFILSVMTFGILWFWIQPYLVMAFLNFYEDVKAEWENRSGSTAHA